MSQDAIVNLLASRFIARKDVRAIQRHDGSWNVDTSDGKREGPRRPWDRAGLEAHISGTQSYGHYLLDTSDTCKLFAFDVDLEKEGVWVDFEADETHVEPQLREAWMNRAHPGRPFFKIQFKEIAHELCRGIYETLGLQTAAAYSGGKGIHVYGFTGQIPAADAREAASIVLDSIGGYEPTRGSNFFAKPRWGNLSIEVFPKQSSLDGKDLGNLMRLPLGRNLKNPSDPTFFIDLTTPMGVLAPVDAEWALTTDNPWKRQGE